MTVSEPTDEAAGPDGRTASGDGDDARRPRRSGIEVSSTLPMSPEASPEGIGPDPSAVLLEAPGEEEVAVVAWPLLWKQRRDRRGRSGGDTAAGPGDDRTPAPQQEHGDHDEHGAAGRTARAERSPWLVLSAALFGLFSVGFSITVLSIAVTDIAREFDTTDNVVIWVITGPLLLGAIVTPAAGKLADLFGARRVYLTAMCLVALFAALAAASWSASSLITFRVIGAAIGAATGPAAIALINRLFPREKRAQALGYWSLVAAGGPVLGVVVGGPVVQAVSWRWIFIAQVPLSLMTVAVCAAIFPDTPRTKVRFDYVGAILLGLGAGSFVIALNRAPESGWGWTNPLIIVLFLASPVLLTAFVLYERRISYQLIPIRYFSRRNFAFPMVNQFFTNFAYMGGFFLTPFLLQRVLGYDQAKTGFVSIVRPLVFAIAGPLAGWAATKVGERTNAVVGGFCLLSSMLLFTTVSQSSTEAVVFCALALSGAGMGITAPAMAAAIANTVDEADLGVSGGAQQMISQIGVVVGTQVMFTAQHAFLGEYGSLKIDQIPSEVLAASYSHGYLIGAMGALLGLIAATFVRATTRSGRLTSAGEQAEAADHSAQGLAPAT